MSTITKKVTVYLQVPNWSTSDLQIYFTDMTDCGYVLIATKEVEFSMNVPEFDVVELELAQLRKTKEIVKETLQAELYIKVQNIEDQIQNLLAIGHDGDIES